MLLFYQPEFVRNYSCINERKWEIKEKIIVWALMEQVEWG